VRAADRRDSDRTLTVITIALVAMALAWRFLTFTGFSNDHYAHYALAQQVLLGERPIRDFSDPGWPLTYLISAAAWQLAGDQMVVEWTVVASAMAAAAGFTFLAAYRLSASLWIAIVVTLLELAIYPRTYAYPKVLVYALGSWLMIRLAAGSSSRRIVPIAAMIAVSFLLRHDHGLYFAVAAVTWVALTSRGDGWSTVTRRVATLTAATAAMLLPWIVFVALNGGLNAYFERAIEYAAAEANASNLRRWPRLTLLPGQPLLGLARPDRPLVQVVWRPGLADADRLALERQYSLDYVRETAEARWYDVRDRSEANLRALSREPHTVETAGLGRVQRPIWREALAYLSPLRVAPALHAPANAEFWLFWLFWSLPAGCAALLLPRLLRRDEAWPGELAVVGGLCAMAPLVNAGFLRDALRTRLPDAVVPALLLGAWVLGLCWGSRWRSVAGQRTAQAIAIAALIVSVVSVRQIGEWPERIELTGIADGLEGVTARAAKVSMLLRLPHRQDVSTPSSVSRALLPFFMYLDRCTTRQDRIIVTGEFPDVVVLAGRAFASDGVVLGAWYSSAAHQDQTIERMRRRPPLFAIYVDADAFRRRFPLVETFLQQRYRPMTEVAALDGSGSVPILVDREHPAQKTDRQTGWPCFAP
jgi:hypothetical protein